MKNSKIEWTDNTENIIRIINSRSFYCTKVSPGCKNCYAELMSRRLSAMGHDQRTWEYKVVTDPPELELRRDILKGWALRKHSKRLFVSSMTDVFGEFVPDAWVYEMLDAMIAAPRQTFQVLTKRAARMRESVNAYCEQRGIQKLPRHIWMVVSVEDQEWADKRIPELLKTKCTVRGLSCEPLLGGLDLTKYLSTDCYCSLYPHNAYDRPIVEEPMIDADCKLHNMEGKVGIDWVIVGGESGRGSRPMHPDWPRSIMNQCKDAGVAFFFKQWGEFAEGSNADVNANNHFVVLNNGDYLPMASDYKLYEKYRYKWQPLHPQTMTKVGKDKSGNQIDEVQYLELPAV